MRSWARCGSTIPEAELVADFDSGGGGANYSEFKNWVGSAASGRQTSGERAGSDGDARASRRRLPTCGSSSSGIAPGEPVGSPAAQVRDRRHRGGQSMMRGMSHRFPRRQRGMGIVETMVGILIGMVVVLAVYNVFALAEGYKRTTVGVADAQTTGLVRAVPARARDRQCRHRAHASTPATSSTCTLGDPNWVAPAGFFAAAGNARHPPDARADPRQRRRERVGPADRHVRHALARRQLGPDRRQADGRRQRQRSTCRARTASASTTGSSSTR